MASGTALWQALPPGQGLQSLAQSIATLRWPKALQRFWQGFCSRDIVSFALLLVFALVCHGWGRCVSRLCYGEHSETAIAFDIGLGIGVLGALGGLLNLFHLARPFSLYTLSAVGLALSFVSMWQRTKCHGLSWNALRTKLWHPGENRSFLALHGVVWLIAAFFCIKLIPTAAFNRADDMHTYLVRPIRMLATGTVGGNPFDMLGLDSLGAQSFFQSFLLLVSPLSWANGFDAVFCFALSGFLILGIARQLKTQWPFSLLAIIVFVSLHPQFVNVSSLYSGTALILASFIACSKLVEAFEATEAPAIWKSCLPLVLLVATLLALKNTFLFLLIGQLPLFFAFLSAAKPLRRRAFVAAAVTAAGIALAVLPWILVTLATYGFPGAWPGHDLGPTALMTKYPSLAAHDMGSLFKIRKLFYGGDQLTYTGVALCILLSGIAALAYRRSETLQGLSFRAPFASATIGAFAAYCFNAHMNDAPTAVRYSCPILIALFPLTGLVLTRLFADAPGSAGASPAPISKPSPFRVVHVILPLAAIALFLPLAFTRFHQAHHARSILSFPLQQADLVYHSYALGPAAVRVRALQNLSEPNQTIFAWMGQPFHLDFERNRILSACDPGLVNPLLRFPAGVPEQELRQYLQSRGVRYVLHQFEGAGILTSMDLKVLLNSFALHRSLADYHLYLKEALLKMSESSRVVYRDEQILLFDLGASDEQIVTQR
jgi:hypothetical protein